MQRLFSNFAGGWPGAGLLLQRFLAGGCLAYSGFVSMSDVPHSALLVLRIVGAAAGVLLLAGLWTPIAGAVAAVVEAWIACIHPGNLWTPLMLAVLAAGLAMIGPGAWSIDARLFGRKQLDLEL